MSAAILSISSSGVRTRSRGLSERGLGCDKFDCGIHGQVHPGRVTGTGYFTRATQRIRGPLAKCAEAFALSDEWLPSPDSAPPAAQDAVASVPLPGKIRMTM